MLPVRNASYRVLVQLLFIPGRISQLEATVREITIARIEWFRPRDGCEFVSEFSKCMPVGVFLRIMVLPWLARIPGFCGKAEAVVGMMSGQANTVTALQLIWPA